MNGVCRFKSTVTFCAAVLLTGLAAVASDGIHLTVARGSVGLDQANLVSNGNLVVNSQQVVGQSFMMGGAGTLRGIEIAPLRDGADATDELLLDLYDGLVTLLGTVSISAAGFPPGAGTVPAPLLSDTYGPGYFNLSGLHVTVSTGQTLSFRLRSPYPTGVCNLATHVCTSGRVGATCFINAVCEKSYRAGESGNEYPDGAAIINGVPNSTFDLAFKVLLEETGSADAVTLEWSGGAPAFTSFRSDDSQTVVDPSNEIGTTSERRWVDVPPVGSLWFYRTIGQAVVDQSNLGSIGNLVVSRDQYPGQSFTVGVGGSLVGIEFAPLLDTAAPSDVIFLDLHDDANVLLGSASITAAGFPPGAGTVPAPLSASTTGPGYFDLSSLNVTVSPGEVLSFAIRPGFAAGVCNLGTHQCTSGRVGEFCFDNFDCEKACRAGVSSGTSYPAGQATVNGVPSPSFDLAFKTFVQAAPD